jgi:hypothetical protein
MKTTPSLCGSVKIQLYLKKNLKKNVAKYKIVLGKMKPPMSRELGHQGALSHARRMKQAFQM